MTKVAKLVYVSLLTRVVVDEGATDEQIAQAAAPAFIAKINDDLMENLEDITDDEECPFGTFDGDKYYL